MSSVSVERAKYKCTCIYIYITVSIECILVCGFLGERVIKGEVGAWVMKCKSAEW